MLQSIVLCFVLFSAISFSYCFHIHRSFTSVKRSLKVVSLQSNTILYSKKITPSQDFRNMDEYRKAVMDVLKSQATDKTKLGGRELLELIIRHGSNHVTIANTHSLNQLISLSRKWGVAYDIQLRKSAPFGEGSANIYVNVMWRYFGMYYEQMIDTISPPDSVSN